jgi:DNA repair exonuclease SbcCD ATPase subunit
MIGENVPPGSEDHDHDHDPKRRISRPDSNALIQGLERLREIIEQRLARLESVARERERERERAAPPVLDRSGLEQKLQQQIASYEEAQLRLRAQAERREQEWQTSLEQLEGDRQLLAEAWDRLEHERIAGEAPAEGPASSRPRTAERASTQPRPRPEVADPANDSVTLGILKQFQALRNDVRRNSRQRGPHVS